ncbi:MAG: T9SS type A sorting domain-containing protein [Ginsengibacter sp.]
MKTLLLLVILSFVVLNGSAHQPDLNNCRSLLDNPSSTELMRMNLYIDNADGSSTWVDGAVTQYGADYSDAIDGNDGRKMTNPGVNVCILRDNINLVVERRQLIVGTDTTFFKMWGLQKRTYEMRFVAQNLEQPGLTARLEDNYLHTSTPVLLNDTTHINIEINNDAGSYASDRFRLIYETESPVAPVVHYTALNDFAGKGGIMLSWVTESEINSNQYFVERSKDGIHFFNAGIIQSPGPGGEFKWTDHFPADAFNYYRVEVVEPGNMISYSNIVNVKLNIKTNRKISVFPNPATVNNFNLDLSDQPTGKYELSLFNSSGIVVFHQTFNKNVGISLVKLQINQKLSPGIYHLEILKPDTQKQSLGVVF